MPERQYIGARYVPVFFNNPQTGDATWLQGVGYEALTIVTYANNTYTSKKQVPAGVGAPNLNPEYWVATGLFNGQVEALRQEVEAVQEDVDELQEDVQDILPITPDKVAAKKYILIADSFGNSETIGGRTWQDYFSDIVGSDNVYKGHTNSGGFVAVGTNGTYLQLLQSMAASITDPARITDIVVETAGNDHGQTGLINALTAFCAYCRTTYPYATVHIAVTSKTETETESVHYDLVYDLIPTLKDSCFAGYHYITNSEYAMHNLATIDGVHPTTATSKTLAGYLYAGVISGSISIFRTWVSASTPLQNGDTVNYRTTVSNGITRITPITSELFMKVYDNANGQSMAYINLEFATLPFTAVWSLSQLCTPVLIQITLSDNSTINTVADLQFKYSNADRVTKLKIETGGFESAITVKKIHVYKFAFSTNTEDLL